MIIKNKFFLFLFNSDNLVPKSICAWTRAPVHCLVPNYGDALINERRFSTWEALDSIKGFDWLVLQPLRLGILQLKKTGRSDISA